MKAEDLFRSFALRRIELQVVGHVNPADDQHLPVQFHLPGRLRVQPPFAGRDPARLQRATKGPGKSPGGRGHDIVQRGGVGRVDGWIHAVVLRDLRMDPEEGWRLLRRQIGATQRPFHPFNADCRAVRHWIIHRVLLARILPQVCHPPWESESDVEADVAKDQRETSPPTFKACNAWTMSAGSRRFV
jgi:hypothetical protein